MIVRLRRLIIVFMLSKAVSEETKLIGAGKSTLAMKHKSLHTVLLSRERHADTV